MSATSKILNRSKELFLLCKSTQSPRAADKVPYSEKLFLPLLSRFSRTKKTAVTSGWAGRDDARRKHVLLLPH